MQYEKGKRYMTALILEMTRSEGLALRRILTDRLQNGRLSKTDEGIVRDAIACITGAFGDQ